MYSATELQMLRAVDNGATIPGIDTSAGNTLPKSSLKALSSIPTTSSNQPFYYDPSQNTVFVQQAGAVLNGYDFGSANVVVVASNVTIENCTFNKTGGYFAVGVYNTAWSPATTNTTVTGCTFIGDPASTLLAAINTKGSATITGNKFLDTAGDGIWADGGGLISGNYFSQAGNNGAAGHPDAIWVTDSVKPLTISNNFIDWSKNPAATVFGTNNTIRITGEGGPVSNVTVTGNFLLNGASTIQAIDVAGLGALSNLSITDNYLEGAMYFTFYPGPMPGSTVSGNVVVDEAYLTNAWNAYRAAGLPTANLLASTDGSTINAGSSSGPTTLYADQRNTLMVGGPNENNFVSGYASQNMWAGPGANVFTYLSTANSAPTAPDTITNFDPAKDVIDVSRIDGDLTAAGVQSFTFIGTSAFDGDAPEVRTQQNADGTTEVQAALAGDTSPDMQIDLTGNQTLTAANFALTAAQSQAAMANGAALSQSVTTGWPLTETQYGNVQGRAYSSYTSIQSGSYLVADDLDLGASSDEIDLFGPSGVSYTSVTIARGGGAESIASDGKTDSLAFHQNETIDAGGAAATPQTFSFSPGFGNVTIKGFATSGANADTLELPTSAFSGLDPGMSDAERLASVLSHVSGTSGSATIADSHGDTLTLSGVTAAALVATPGLVKFT